MMPTEQQVVVTAALIVAVGLIAMFLGRWWGLGQGREQGYEEREWEEAKARRTHPAYRQPPEITHEDGPGYMMGYRLVVNGQQVYDWQHDDPEPFSPETAAKAIDTGEIQAITDRTDAWMAKWIEDGHALRDS